jgi:hypothetical protein
MGTFPFSSLSLNMRKWTPRVVRIHHRSHTVHVPQFCILFLWSPGALRLSGSSGLEVNIPTTIGQWSMLGMYLFSSPPVWFLKNSRLLGLQIHRVPGHTFCNVLGEIPTEIGNLTNLGKLTKTHVHVDSSTTKGPDGNLPLCSCFESVQIRYWRTDPYRNWKNEQPS